MYNIKINDGSVVLYKSNSTFSHKIEEIRAVSAVVNHIDHRLLIITENKELWLYHPITDKMHMLQSDGVISAKWVGDMIAVYKDLTHIDYQKVQLLRDDETIICVLQYKQSDLTIISGGQTGIDELGLSLAKAHGLPTSGIMPPDYATEEGPKPEFKALYNVCCLTSGNYAKRTKCNIQLADATVLFGDIRSTGSQLNLRFSKFLKQPICVNPTADELIAFVEAYDIRILNVAGNKQSKLSEEHKAHAQISLTGLFQNRIAIRNYNV